MFDPNYNAVKDYYLVNGTLAGNRKLGVRSAEKSARKVGVRSEPKKIGAKHGVRPGKLGVTGKLGDSRGKPVSGKTGVSS
jgi:hypothetical protein